MYAICNFFIVLSLPSDVMGKKIGLALNAFGTLPAVAGAFEKTAAIDIALMSCMGCLIGLVFTVINGEKSFATYQAQGMTALASQGCIAALDSIVENFSGDRSTAVSDPPTLLTQVQSHLTRAIKLQPMEHVEIPCCSTARKTRTRRVRMVKLLQRCHSHLSAMEQARQHSFSPLQEQFSKRIHPSLLALCGACRVVLESLARESQPVVEVEAMVRQHKQLLASFTAARMELVISVSPYKHEGKRAQGLAVGSLREAQCLAARYSLILQLGLMVNVLRVEVPRLDGDDSSYTRTQIRPRSGAGGGDGNGGAGGGDAYGVAGGGDG
jgi:hypothetical protein